MKKGLNQNLGKVLLSSINEAIDYKKEPGFPDVTKFLSYFLNYDASMEV